MGGKCPNMCGTPVCLPNRRWAQWWFCVQRSVKNAKLTKCVQRSLLWYSWTLNGEQALGPLVGPHSDLSNQGTSCFTFAGRHLWDGFQASLWAHDGKGRRTSARSLRFTFVGFAPEKILCFRGLAFSEARANFHPEATTQHPGEGSNCRLTWETPALYIPN